MKEAQYQAEAAKFRAKILAEAAKPEDQRDFPTEWLTVEVLSTCQNGECPNFQIPFRVTLSENADGVYRCICGRCSTWVWDLVPLFDDGPGKRLKAEVEVPNHHG